MGWEVSFNRERPGGTGVPGCLTTPQHRHGLTTDDTLLPKLLQQHRGHMICQITVISQFSDLRSYKVQINVSTRFPTAPHVRAPSTGDGRGPVWSLQLTSELQYGRGRTYGFKLNYDLCAPSRSSNSCLHLGLMCDSALSTWVSRGARRTQSFSFFESVRLESECNLR